MSKKDNKNEYNQKRNELAERLKNQPSETPIQKVEPIKETEKVQEQQLNVWIPKTLMKRLKNVAVEQDKSLKEIIIELIDKHL